MTWPVVARRDIRILREDNTLGVFLGVFAVLAAAVSYGTTNSPQPGPLADVLALLYLFAVPLAAGTLVHEAIPDAVESGRIRLTLSLPHTRTDFLAGVGTARLAGLLAAVAVSLAAGATVHVARGGPVSPVAVAGTVALGVLLGAAFVAATLAMTARTSSTTFAAAASYGFFVLAFVWPAAVAVARVVLAGQFRVAVPAGTVETVVQLSPIYAYQNALAALGASTAASGGAIPAWGCVLVLLAWTVGGFAVAARRFGARDL